MPPIVISAPVPPPRPVLDPSSVLGKVQTIMEAYTCDDDVLTLADIARRTGLAKTTVYRLCHDLTVWGALEHWGAGYRLGLRLFELGQLAPRQRILLDVARPYMEDLFLSTQATVHLAVRADLRVLYLEKLGARRTPHPSRVGGHLPLHATSTGKVILAHSPEHVLRAVLDAGLPALTRHTTVSAARLAEQLARVRSRGVFTEIEETRLGYLSVAAPLLDGRGALRGALAVTVVTSHPQRHRLEGLVRDTSVKVGTALARGDVCGA